jgi:hypothetical protein
VSIKTDIFSSFLRKSINHGVSDECKEYHERGKHLVVVTDDFLKKINKPTS